MKIQLQDAQGNKLEPTIIELGENDLLLVKLKKQIGDINHIGRDFQEAAESGSVLIIPDWVELIVVKETP